MASLQAGPRLLLQPRLLPKALSPGLASFLLFTSASGSKLAKASYPPSAVGSVSFPPSSSSKPPVPDPAAAVSGQPSFPTLPEEPSPAFSSEYFSQLGVEIWQELSATKCHRPLMRKLPLQRHWHLSWFWKLDDGTPRPYLMSSTLLPNLELCKPPLMPPWGLHAPSEERKGLSLITEPLLAATAEKPLSCEHQQLTTSPKLTSAPSGDQLPDLIGTQFGL
ncbi:Titin [Manis pentadactyla]|nr:Titin [Manis pentadactyla]